MNQHPIASDIESLSTQLYEPEPCMDALSPSGGSKASKRLCAASSPAKLTKLKSIRAFCLECVGGEGWADVRDCQIKDCHFHPYRFGKLPKEKAALTVGKAIDATCLSCMGERLVNGKSIGRGIAAKRARACHQSDKCHVHHIRYGQPKHFNSTSTGQEQPNHIIDDVSPSEKIKAFKTQAEEAL